MLHRCLHWAGIDLVRVSHGERCLAAIGATIGIASTWGISSLFLGPEASMLMLASMGAGAVLLFAVPHGALSQPWPALGGHLISALIGVTCAQWISDIALAASVAVGLAVLLMHYSHSLHPPGGATALIAVIGGTDVHALGYAYVVAPVMLNALTIFLIALIFNNLSAHRRYPAARANKPSVQNAPPSMRISNVCADDVRKALDAMDLVEDISEEDIMAIIVRAENIARLREETSK